MQLLIPFISAFIGWVTNWVAIKMLFHPKVPIKLGFVTLHGVFPKNQDQFASKIANLVGNELFSFADIKEKMNSTDNHEEILKVINDKIDIFLKEKLVAAMPMLAMIMGDELRNKIKTTLVAEFETMLPEVIENYANNLEKKINVKEVVEAKVKKFSLEKMEEVMYGIMSKEFRFIEVVGAVLGFLIGLLQILIAEI